MKIIFDARPLQEKNKSGVHLYTEELAAHLLAKGGADITFFRNGLRPLPALPNSWYSHPYEEVTAHLPNKLLTLSWILRLGQSTGRFADSKASDGSPGTLIFAPNINFFKLRADDRFVLTIHDLSFAIEPNWFSAKQRLWHALAAPAALARRAAMVIAVSPHTKKDLIDIWGLAEEKISVITPGIPREAPPEHLPGLPEQFVLTIGNVEKRKNTDGLILAFEKIADKPEFHDLHLVILGASHFGADKILKLVTMSRFHQRIHHYGYVNEGQKTFALRRARLFVYPSFYEGFGFPPLEALRASVPVVASFGGALSETLGGAALLVNPFLVNEIAEAMEVLLTSEKLRNTLAQKAADVLNRYSWDASAAAHLKIFETLK